MLPIYWRSIFPPILDIPKLGMPELGAHTKQKKTYEKISSVFGYNLAKPKKKSACKKCRHF
jgi:hypothetical protein